MAGFVNFLIELARVIWLVVRALVPIVAGLFVFGIVHGAVFPIVAGAYLGSLMALMFSGALGFVACMFLGGFLWRR